MNLVKLTSLDQLTLPSHVDGSQGNNRVLHKPCHIAAINDLEAIKCWLAEYANKPHTYRNYQKDAERLLLWSINIKQKPLSSLDGEDLLAYSEFLDDPQPKEIWCGPKQARGGQRWSQAWRPFVSGLSPQAKITTFANLNSLFTYLINVRCLDHNPLASVRRQIKHHSPIAEYKWRVTERIIDFEEWSVFRNVLNNLPETSYEERGEKTRLQFLISLLYFGGLRNSELTNHGMSAFKRTHDYQANKERWWLEIKGKGDKMRKIPVNQSLLHSLIDYRRLQNLSDFPQPYETEPLIKSFITNQAISSQCVNQLIKSIAEQAAKHFEKDQPEKAKKMRKFSAHWLRHLSVSMQGLAKIDKQVIKENVGHKSIQTTEVYMHTFENYQHDEMEKLVWEPTVLSKTVITK